MSETVLLIVRGLLLALSFTGLCATLRSSLKIDRFCTPFIAASGIIVILMCSGMLGILRIGFLLVYFGGFAGLVYTYFIRKVRPDFAVIGICIIFCIYLIWRFLPVMLAHNDDFSHWAKAVRHLIRTNAFPDESTPLYYFDAYPLGAAVWVYYISHATAGHEWIWLVAQNLLMGLCFLPVLAHIRSHRKYLYPVAFILFIYLFKYFRDLDNLLVDWLLGFYGIGIAASVVCHREKLKEALLCCVIGGAAVTYIKNSGMFFAVVAACILIFSLKNLNISRRKSCFFSTIVLLTPILFFLLWTLHVRIQFTHGLESAHAVSLAAYAREASSKSSELIQSIATDMLLKRLPMLFSYHGIAFLLIFACFIACAIVCFPQPSQRKALCHTGIYMLCCVGIYLAWYLMTLCMYIFSMSDEEAASLASLGRYESTVLIYVLGLAGIIVFRCIGRKEVLLSIPVRICYFIAIIASVVVLSAAGTRGTSIFSKLMNRSVDNSFRLKLQSAKADLDISPDSRLLISVTPGSGSFVGFPLYFSSEYEFETNQLIFLHYMEDNNGESPYYALGSGNNIDSFTADRNAMALIEPIIDEYDALIIVDHNPQLESDLNAFLERYEGDTLVYFAGQ